MKWEKIAIEDLCLKVTSGGTPLRSRTEFYDGGTIPWIKTKEVNFNRIYDADEKITEKGLDNSSAKLIPENSILIAMYGDGHTAGRCAISRLPVTTNQACCNLVINPEKANPDYMFYKISTLYEIFRGLKSGGSQQNLNAKTLREFQVQIPPLPTQRKIASILSAYDDLIENNLKRIKLLEEKANLHYKELMQDSAKWEKVRLEEFVSVVKGRKPTNVLEQQEEESQLYLLLDTVERGKTLYTTDLSLPQSKITDVLMCMDGARSGLSFRGMVGAIGSTMAIWRSNSERVSGEYLFQFMKQNESAITQGNTGAAIPHANRKFILDMKMAMPPKKEAEYFDGLTVPMIKLINTLHNQNTKLREARDILLPRLMNGQIEM